MYIKISINSEREQEFSYQVELYEYESINAPISILIEYLKVSCTWDTQSTFADPISFIAVGYSIIKYGTSWFASF